MHLICPLLLESLSSNASKALNQISISEYDFVLQWPHAFLGNTLKCTFQDIKSYVTSTKMLQSSKLMSKVNQNLLASIEFSWNCLVLELKQKFSP